MQFFYKWFVSDEEVLKNLPLIIPRKLSNERLEKLIMSVRKHLFFKKLKKLIKLNQRTPKWKKENKKV